VFWCGHCKYLFVSAPNDANINGRIFSNGFEWLSPAWQFANSIPEQDDFLRTNISQGSEREGCDIELSISANSQLSLSMKEF